MASPFSLFKPLFHTTRQAPEQTSEKALQYSAPIRNVHGKLPFFFYGGGDHWTRLPPDRAPEQAPADETSTTIISRRS